MEFKMKRLTSVLISVFMLLNFTCCTNSQQEQTTQNSEAVSETTVRQTTVEQKETDTDPTEGSFKIGIIVNADKKGTAVKEGAQTAIDEINALGKMRFEIKVEDGNSSGAYDTLMQWGMQVLVGSTDDVASETLVTRSHTDSIFHVVLSDSAQPSVVSKDNIMRLCNAETSEAVRFTDYVASKLPGQKTGVIYQSDSRSSLQVFEEFQSLAANRGVNHVYSESFTKNNGWDFSVQLSKALSEGVEVMVLPVQAEKAALIIEQADAMGYKPVFIGGEELKSMISLKGINRRYIDNVVIVTAFSVRSQGAATDNFVKTYKTLYGKNPGLYAAYGYDAVHVIYECITAAKVKKYTIDSSKLCKKLISVRDDFVFNGLTGENMKWDAEGELSSVPCAVVIKNGVCVQ